MDSTTLEAQEEILREEALERLFSNLDEPEGECLLIVVDFLEREVICTKQI